MEREREGEKGMVEEREIEYGRSLENLHFMCEDKHVCKTETEWLLMSSNSRLKVFTPFVAQIERLG